MLFSNIYSTSLFIKGWLREGSLQPVDSVDRMCHWWPSFTFSIRSYVQGLNNYSLPKVYTKALCREPFLFLSCLGYFSRLMILGVIACQYFSKLYMGRHTSDFGKHRCATSSSSLVIFKGLYSLSRRWTLICVHDMKRGAWLIERLSQATVISVL